MPVAGDHLIRRELIQQMIELRQILAGFAAVRAALIVVPCQKERHRYVLDGVPDHRTLSTARFARRRCSRGAPLSNRAVVRT